MSSKKRKKARRAGKPLNAPASAPPPSIEADRGRPEEDFRRTFLAQCAEAAQQGVENMRCPMREEAAPAGAGAAEAGSLLFDIINCCFSPFDGTGSAVPMPLYVSFSGSRPVPCRRQGMYREPLVSCYELFCDESREETGRLQQSILHLSIQDAAGGRAVKPGFGLMCLMPDVVDDFNHVFRTQLSCQGLPLFQVPRSIALAYTLRAQGREIPREFLCIDYDGEECCAIKIREIEGEDGPVFVRMGRENLSGEHLSYRKLAEEYLWRYQRKYQLTLTPEAVSNLLDTKLLQRLVHSPAHPILTDNGGTALSIQADQRILEVLEEKVLQDLRGISRRSRIPAYGLCAFFADGGGELFSIRQLEQGCRELRRRGMEQRVLWQEYLPHLELEVSRNGVFDRVELIGERHRRQNISTFLLEEVMEFPVSDGIVTFPANGETHYDLPLVREVYGRHNKEKLARFHLDAPLERDIEVELTVYYRYGDVDSYKLIARSQDLAAPLESVWCDQAETLENQAPSYQELERHDFDEEEFRKVYQSFLSFAEKVRGAQRPARTHFGSVYEKPRGSARYYSKYLYDLNQRGLPYFHIQNFFRQESFEASKPYLAGLMSEGIFACVAQVLRGELPAGHNLGTDFHCGQEEGRILIQNMAEIACNFGCLFALRDADPASTQVNDTVEEILQYFRDRRTMKLQEWAPITRYVPRAWDSHGIWDSFSEALRQLDPRKPGKTVYDLRAISGVCYQTENWIFEFYHGPNGRRDVNWLLKNIQAVLYSPECIAPRSAEEKYNPRKIRDVLELLLCICRLKREDPLILDSNAPETKALVKQLKVIDRGMRELEERQLLRFPFDTRLGIEPPEAYRRVNPVIYALIQTLTGGKPVSLIGFTSDESQT